MYKDGGNASDAMHYHYPEEPSVDVDLTTSANYELVVTGTPMVEGNATQPVPKILPTTTSTN